MQTLLKLDTIMISVERIRLLNLEATIGQETGIEIGVFGLESTFQITGLAAQRAYQYLKEVTPSLTAPKTPTVVVTLNGVQTPVLEVTTIDNKTIPVSFVIGNDVFNVADIEWIDLATDFGTLNGTGIEMRLACDPVGETRQFVLERAESAYNTLVALAVNQEAV